MMAKKKINKKSKSRSHLRPAKVQASAKKNLSRKKSHQKDVPFDEPLEETNFSDESGLDENVLVEADISQPNEDLLIDVLNEKQPKTAAELSEDPVRLYLREIGQVELLKSR